jgi:hypothetical protein
MRPGCVVWCCPARLLACAVYAIALQPTMSRQWPMWLLLHFALRPAGHCHARMGLQAKCAWHTHHIPAPGGQHQLAAPLVFVSQQRLPGLRRRCLSSSLCTLLGLFGSSRGCAAVSRSALIQARSSRGINCGGGQFENSQIGMANLRAYLCFCGLIRMVPVIQRRTLRTADITGFPMLPSS